MTTRITITTNTFMSFEMYKQYLRDRMYKEYTVQEYFTKHVDGLQMVSFGGNHTWLDFESEAHYTWFLLQQ